MEMRGEMRGKKQGKIQGEMQFDEALESVASTFNVLDALEFNFGGESEAS